MQNKINNLLNWVKPCQHFQHTRTCESKFQWENYFVRISNWSSLYRQRIDEKSSTCAHEHLKLCIYEFQNILKLFMLLQIYHNFGVCRLIEGWNRVSSSVAIAFHAPMILRISWYYQFARILRVFAKLVFYRRICYVSFVWFNTSSHLRISMN